VGPCAGDAAVLSAIKVWRAAPPPVTAPGQRLWRDPGDVRALDLAMGPGATGPPQPPFRFADEHSTGSSPSISVTDAAGQRWRIKWGDEAKPEAFATRVVWAAGYFAETTFFVPAGRIEGVTTLDRARDCVDEDGGFVDARFEIEDTEAQTRFDEHGWSWDDNPFVGTRELAGLKILHMLLSNWDSKDVRDVSRGSNTGIFEYRLPGGTREARYLIIDWGGSMGLWGSVLTRTKWDWEGFAAQTPEFITGVAEGVVSWGYDGQRTADIAAGITVEDVRWLHTYLGRLTDAQIRAALDASGATPDEREAFAHALRQRIGQLRHVAQTGSAPRRRHPTLPLQQQLSCNRGCPSRFRPRARAPFRPHGRG
jgi:hypothetical protein